MIDHDDRTAEEKKSHPIIVVMTDRFMSGWGKAQGGASFAGWACRDSDVDRVERWVRRRGDAKNVRIVTANWRPKGAAHATVYVVRDGHPAL